MASLVTYGGCELFEVQLGEHTTVKLRAHEASKLIAVLAELVALSTLIWKKRIVLTDEICRVNNNEDVDHARVDRDAEDGAPLPQWREYQKGGITIRVPAEPPKLTPRAARALLSILTELSDEKVRSDGRLVSWASRSGRCRSCRVKNDWSAVEQGRRRLVD